MLDGGGRSPTRASGSARAWECHGEPSSKTAALARRQPQSCHDEAEAEERAQALLPLTRCGSPRPFRSFVIFTDSLAAGLWDGAPDPDVGAAPSGTRDGPRHVPKQ